MVNTSSVLSSYNCVVVSLKNDGWINLCVICMILSNSIEFYKMVVYCIAIKNGPNHYVTEHIVLQEVKVLIIN